MSDPRTRHEITFLRHGLSEANQMHIVQGQTDSPLSEIGISQVRALAELWQHEGTHFDTIISSPLERAAMTTKLLVEKIPADVEFSDSWKERRYGTAEGMTYDEFREMLRQSPPPSPYHNTFGDGESEWDLFARASQAVQNILRLPPATYLVVSHGGMLNAAVQSILGITPAMGIQRARFRFENTGHTQLIYDPSRQTWWLSYANDHRHLFADGLHEH